MPPGARAPLATPLRRNFCNLTVLHHSCILQKFRNYGYSNSKPQRTNSEEGHLQDPSSSVDQPNQTFFDSIKNLCHIRSAYKFSTFLELGSFYVLCCVRCSQNVHAPHTVYSKRCFHGRKLWNIISESCWLWAHSSDTGLSNSNRDACQGFSYNLPERLCITFPKAGPERLASFFTSYT